MKSLFSKAKIIVREHESDVYICLACWFVEQVPELQGVEIDTHISLITLPAGSSAGIPTEHIKLKMEKHDAQAWSAANPGRRHAAGGELGTSGTEDTAAPQLKHLSLVNATCPAF